MQTQPTILTNMAFHNATWQEATHSICRDNETPDQLPAGLQVWRVGPLPKKICVRGTTGAPNSPFLGGFFGLFGPRLPQKMTAKCL